MSVISDFPVHVALFHARMHQLTQQDHDISPLLVTRFGTHDSSKGLETTHVPHTQHHSSLHVNIHRCQGPCSSQGLATTCS